jgi:cytidylate kinase
MEKKIYSVAVDGPSGAGKSTLAKAAAAKLGIVYVDTGAIYRSIGYYVYCKGIDPKDAPAVIAILPELDIQMRYGEDGVQRMILNGEDVSTQIRLPEMSMYASAVSAIPEVRTFLLEMQRQIARTTSVIMDGRDIGTVVLPNAEVKIFLTAAAEVRAQRRMKELEQRGTPQPFEEVLQQIVERDWADSHREAAPLKQAEDAVLVDTTELSLEQSEDAIAVIIAARLQESAQ